MEEFVLDSVGFIGNVDFAFVLRIFLYIYLFFWLMVVIWVWFDASERSSSLVFKIFGVLVSLVFNIFGLLIYLLVRPSDSYEERYLSELEKKYLQLETSGVIKCPGCSFDLEPSFVVCPRCGQSVKVKCDSCEEYIDSHWEFCAFCGIQRDVPESLREQYLKIDLEEPKQAKTYYRAIRNCLYKVGEKQNKCLKKTREFFKKQVEERKKDKVVTETKKRVTKKTKKAKKKRMKK